MVGGCLEAGVGDSRALPHPSLHLGPRRWRHRRRRPTTPAMDRTNPSTNWGLIPYNFICVRTGSILSEISSLDDIFSWATLAQLLAIALMALLPGAAIKRYGEARLRVDGMDREDTIRKER